MLVQSNIDANNQLVFDNDVITDLKKNISIIRKLINELCGNHIIMRTLLKNTFY